MTVFMLIVSEIIPPTSDSVPLVFAFFSAVMVEMVLMIIILCYILKLHFKSSDDEPMPKWMRKFILENMSYCLGIQKRPKTNVMIKSNNNNHNNKCKLVKELDKRMKSINMIHQSGTDGIHSTGTSNNITVTYVHNNAELDNTSESCFLSSPMQESCKGFFDNSSPSSPLLNQKIDCILKRFAEEDEEKFIKKEWRICALTLDRMSLIFFGIVFAITSASCFLTAPGYTP